MAQWPFKGFQAEGRPGGLSTRVGLVFGGGVGTMDSGAEVMGSLVLLFVATWVVVLLPAGMAGRRNRSAVLWSLVSLLGSPPLAILALLVPGKSR